MSFTAWIIEYIASLVEYLGYPGIFILMTLESSGIPIPSEAVVTFAGFLASRGVFNLYMIILISTLANLTGSIIFYYLGYIYGESFVHKYGRFLRINDSHIKFIEKWFDRYGDITVFIGRITPAIRTYISLPAGMGKMNKNRFIILTLVGSLIWNLFLAYIGLWLGDNWISIVEYLDIIAVIAMIIIIIILFYLKRIGWKI